MDNKVGGYFGVNMTSSKTEFFLQKSVIEPGTDLHVQINANNSSCNNSIKSFKFKLWRRATYKFNGNYIETGEYLSNIKLPGCKPKEAVKREYSIPMPLYDRGYDTDGSTTLCNSTNSSLFSVEYMLRCFVKHQSIFEIGQGHCV